MRIFSFLAFLSVPFAVASDSILDEVAEAARVKAALAMRAKLTNCTDSIEGWVDIMESPCSWYAEEPVARCEMAEVLESEDGSAEDVCCACGGGDYSTTTTTTTEVEDAKEVTRIPFSLGCGKCTDYKNWLDALMSGCDFYEEHTDIRCALAGYAASGGIGADEACCVCGGGKSEGCEGTYYIESASGLYLAIQKHGSRVPYINAFGTQNILTKLVVESVGNELYSIRSAHYGDRYMCVGGDGQGVTTCGSVGKSAKWYINFVSNNKFTIESFSNGKYLDFINVNSNNALYPVALTKDNIDMYTKFKFVKTSTSSVEELEFTEEKKNLRTVA